MQILMVVSVVAMMLGLTGCIILLMTSVNRDEPWVFAAGVAILGCIGAWAWVVLTTLSTVLPSCLRY